MGENSSMLTIRRLFAWVFVQGLAKYPSSLIFYEYKRITKKIPDLQYSKAQFHRIIDKVKNKKFTVPKKAGRNRSWTMTEAKAIVAQLREGQMSISKAASQFKYSRDTIRRMMRAVDKTFNRIKVPKVEDEVKQLEPGQVLD